MVTVHQTRDFLSGRRLNRSRIVGSFFSRANAEAALGWYFLQTCCIVERF